MARWVRPEEEDWTEDRRDWIPAESAVSELLKDGNAINEDRRSGVAKRAGRDEEGDARF